jgi:hypothetical protein
MKATLTSENTSGVKVLSRSDAEMIINNIKKELQTWKLKNYLYHALVGILGTIAILGSVIVSVYLDTTSTFLTAERLKIIAIASTTSLSILSAFSILSKTNNYIAACDLMQVALFKYSAKLIGLGTLIEAYDKANKIIGGIDFNFEKNFTGTNGKTVVSVNTGEEETPQENETETDVQPETAPGAPTDQPAPLGPRKETDTATVGLTGPTTEPRKNAIEPDRVKSEAIIEADDVSVLVSEKK